MPGLAASPSPAFLPSHSAKTVCIHSIVALSASSGRSIYH